MYSKLYCFCTFGGKNPLFVTKNCSKSSYIFAFILSENSTIDSRKTSINHKWLVVESCTIDWCTIIVSSRVSSPPAWRKKILFPPVTFPIPGSPGSWFPPPPPRPLPFTTTRYEVQNDVAALPYKIKSNLKKASKISTLKFF